MPCHPLSLACHDQRLLSLLDVVITIIITTIIILIHVCLLQLSCVTGNYSCHKLITALEGKVNYRCREEKDKL